MDKIPKLSYQSCNDDGQPEGEVQILEVQGFHNDRPYWSLDYQHYFVYESGWDGGPVEDFWCMANMKFSTPCFYSLYRPRKEQTTGSFLPEGPWIRGRPWRNDMFYPRDVPQFYLTVLLK
jgi:hypothetical protein